MTNDYEKWLREVESALATINMPLETWQSVWKYDFSEQYRQGRSPSATAEMANRYWWWQQNRAVGQACTASDCCWLPRGHSGACQSKDVAE